MPYIMRSTVTLDTRQNPWLGIEPLRESWLETLNDFASQWRQQQKKHDQPLPGQPTTWPISMMPIAERPHYMQSETNFGSMDRTSQQHI